MYLELPSSASKEEKSQHYQSALDAIGALLDIEDDWIAAMATVACELHHRFSYFNWTGFYRTVSPELLKVGPYQGSHGCLVIPFSKGVCGAAARTRKTQLVADVNSIADHIACSSTTQSEIVVPIVDIKGQTRAVLDVDSDLLNAFDETDQMYLERLCQKLADKYF